MKIYLGLFLIFLTFSVKAYEVKGFIQLKENWERRIYLSSITSFDDMNTASEEFVIASANIMADGSFHIEGTQIPAQFGLYRLHVVKKGDPVGTLIISGQEENHYHFIMNNNSQLDFYTGDLLFTDASFQNSTLNNNFNQLKEKIETFQKAPDIPSKLNWDYQERELQNYLLQYADTSQNILTAMYAIYHINIGQDYSKHSNFLQSFLKKWKPESKSSSYFLQLEQQVEFFHYRNGPRISPVLFYILLIILSLSIIIWIKMKKTIKKDPFIEKQNQLTVQEQKIFELLSQGKTNKELSNELNIEVSTVKSHLNNIYAKLGVKSRKEIYNRRKI